MMDNKQIAINLVTTAVFCLLIGGCIGFLSSDGIPEVVRLDEISASNIRLEETNNCNTLVGEITWEVKDDVRRLENLLVGCENRNDTYANLNNVAWGQVDKLRLDVVDLGDVVSDLNTSVNDFNCEE